MQQKFNNEKKYFSLFTNLNLQARSRGRDRRGSGLPPELIPAKKVENCY